MTPKEKALELVNKFIPHSSGNSNNNEAKECALIAVDELIENVPDNDYWIYTKKEIKKL